MTYWRSLEAPCCTTPSLPLDHGMMLWMLQYAYILGPAMLAPNFENNSGTIPAAGARYKASCFSLGMPDNTRTEGTGSNLYYVNKYALKFGGKTLSSE